VGVSPTSLSAKTWSTLQQWLDTQVLKALKYFGKSSPPPLPWLSASVYWGIDEKEKEKNAGCERRRKDRGNGKKIESKKVNLSNIFIYKYKNEIVPTCPRRGKNFLLEGYRTLWFLDKINSQVL
jgi:hypothetical protein